MLTALRLNVSPGCTIWPLTASAARLMFCPESAANPPVVNVEISVALPSDCRSAVVISAGLFAYTAATVRSPWPVRIGSTFAKVAS